MTTKATSTKGIQLQRGDGAGSEAFTTIAELDNIKAGEEKAQPINATSFDSSAMEYIGGLLDSGDVTFDCFFIGSDAQQQGLRADLRAGTKRNFKLNLNDHISDPSILSFAGVVIAAPGVGGGVNSAIKSSGCAVKVSGLYSWHYRPS